MLLAQNDEMVNTLTTKMFDCGSMRFVIDEFLWDKPVFLQKITHEFQRCLLVPSALKQHIKHLDFKSAKSAQRVIAVHARACARGEYSLNP